MKEKYRNTDGILYHFFQVTEDNIDKPEIWPNWMTISVFIPNDRMVRVSTENPNKIKLEKLNLSDYILHNDKCITKVVSPKLFKEEYTII